MTSSRRTFYSRFFSRASFLSYSTQSLYTQAAYLQSQGFDTSLDLNDKVVLELGAGAGRLTLALAETGNIAQARSYIVVEPSEGIRDIQQQLSAANVTFLNCSLEDLAAFVAPGSVDYLIAAGVIPHLDGSSLADVLGRIVPFLAPGGTLHIVSSFYGFHKRLARRLKVVCRRAPAMVPVCAGFSALVMWLSRSVPDLAGRALAVRNLIYSFQTSLRQIYRQQQEFFAVEPYSIFWSYRDYAQALSEHGFVIDRVYPHCIAIRASRQGPPVMDFSPFPAGSSVAILGQGWVSRWFARLLDHPKQRLAATTDQAATADIVVIAYDYTRAEPYYLATTSLEGRGFVLGKNLFLFQMLL